MPLGYTGAALLPSRKTEAGMLLGSLVLAGVGPGGTAAPRVSDGGRGSRRAVSSKGASGVLE